MDFPVPDDVWYPRANVNGGGDLPFFPIVPRNVPPDDLSSYLRLFNDEAMGLYAATRPGYGVPAHYERFVNGPYPVMRTLRGLGTEPDGSATIGECGTLSEWARGNGVAPTAAGAADPRVWCYTSATPEIRGPRVAYLFTVRGGVETRTITVDAILRSPVSAPAPAQASSGAGMALLAVAALAGAWYAFR